VLLAKSVRDGDSIPESATLAGHHADVFAASAELIQATAPSQLSALGLDTSFTVGQLGQVVKLAAAVHDFGKATDVFSAVLSGSRKSTGLRHEWISVWWLTQPAIKEWLLPVVGGDEMLWTAVSVAVASHHRRPPWDGDFSFELAIQLQVDDAQFQKCIHQVRDWFHLGEPPSELPALVYPGPSKAKSIRDWYWNLRADTAEAFEEFEARHPTWRRFVAAAKASLIAADVAGSALWEHLPERQQRLSWIRDTLTQKVPSSEIQAIADHRLNGNKLFPFQQAISDSDGDVTLVEAGCGAGKTVAAYLWAARQQAGRRIWFCYPTTGTASEGFFGYLVDPDNDKKARPGAELFHSRSEFDRLRLMTSPVEFGGKEKCDEVIDETEVRIQSLRAWETRINCCTVDTVLGLMQNHRAGVYAWPSIAQSAIIFDEVHCYDDRLFPTFLEFLRHLPGIPVLLMTASLPTWRKEAIESACVDRKLVQPRCDTASEQTKRYVYLSDSSLTESDDAIQAVEDVIENADADGERVLWISNTVARTRRVANELSFLDPKIYHSRFKYMHRCDRHTEVVELFKGGKSGVATTTQVAEMSLDLKTATLLVTELAPIPSMIQRLGRLNRSAHLVSNPRPRPFMVIEPQNDGEFSPNPYDAAELELARRWLETLGNEPLSQADLVEKWHALDDCKKDLNVLPAWIHDEIEPHTNNPLRLGDYGVTVIDQDDVASIDGPTGAVAFALPMDRPRSATWQVGRCRGYPIAARGTLRYCEVTGGEWASFQCE
jgi:CRISPR-associated endonuclease/helicase Cas3